MKITILGAGSIGLLFTAYLASIGHELTVITRTSRQKEHILENKIRLVKGDVDTAYPVNALNHEDKQHLSDIKGDLLIIAVKQIHLDEVMPLIKKLSAQYHHILFIQNGMGHLGMVEKLIHPSIILGVVEHGALRRTDHVVEHTGVGITRLASYRGTLPEKMIEQIATENFKIKEEASWYEMLANKLVVNAVINPLTAIFKVKNGELLKIRNLQILMKKLFDEAIEILELQNPEKLWEQVLHVCESTAMNSSSMLRDIQNKQKTEIDAISGYLIKKATLSLKAIPNTEFVYNGIKAIEESWK